MTDHMRPQEKEIYYLTNRVIKLENETRAKLSALKAQQDEQALINGELRRDIKRLDLAMGAFRNLDGRISDLEIQMTPPNAPRQTNKPSLWDRLFTKK